MPSPESPANRTVTPWTVSRGLLEGAKVVVGEIIVSSIEKTRNPSRAALRAPAGPTLLDGHEPIASMGEFGRIIGPKSDADDLAPRTRFKTNKSVDCSLKTRAATRE
jgi:hypothetical protein